ncbi:hypothetical protein ACFL6U_12205 [Planctomycetota bacterium]
MNQLELNQIAQAFVQQQSVEVARSVKSVLSKDLDERVQELPGLAVRHIHNMALFNVLLGINLQFQSENNQESALRECLTHAESIRPKFLDIIESLQDFQPSGISNEDNEQLNN